MLPCEAASWRSIKREDKKNATEDSKSMAENLFV